MLIVEQAATAAEAGLAVAGEIQSEAEARTPVEGLRIGAVIRDAGVPAERFTPRRSGKLGRAHVVVVVVDREELDAPFDFVPGRRRLETQTEVQRQPVGHAEVVLNERG